MIVDVNEVARKLKELGWLRTNDKITGNYLICYCPFHSNGEEKKPSAGMLLSDEMRDGQLYSQGWFHCFGCSTSLSLLDFINKLLDLHHIEMTATQWLKENIISYQRTVTVGEQQLVDDSLIDAFERKRKKQKESLERLFKKEEQTFISEEELQSYRFTCPYMYERKMTDELIEKFDVGVDMNFVPPGSKTGKKVPCITFPVRDEYGRTMYIIRRSIKGKHYFIPSGINKGLYGLYELPENCRNVILCESCINAITSTKYGKPAIALFGTGSSSQFTQMKRLRIMAVTLAFDGDKAGQTAVEKWKRALRGKCVVWTMHLPEGKDINDLSYEEFQELYDEKD